MDMKEINEARSKVIREVADEVSGELAKEARSEVTEKLVHEIREKEYDKPPREQLPRRKGASVTLHLDDGTDLECMILTIYKAANDLRYAAVLPSDDKGKESREAREVYLYRLVEGNGTPTLDNIADDVEYAFASDGFDDWLDRREMEELDRM